jgi:hypothetical protein
MVIQFKKIDINSRVVQEHPVRLFGPREVPCIYLQENGSPERLGAERGQRDALAC